MDADPEVEPILRSGVPEQKPQTPFWLAADPSFGQLVPLWTVPVSMTALAPLPEPSRTGERSIGEETTAEDSLAATTSSSGDSLSTAAAMPHSEPQGLSIEDRAKVTSDQFLEAPVASLVRGSTDRVSPPQMHPVHEAVAETDPERVNAEIVPEANQSATDFAGGAPTPTPTAATDAPLTLEKPSQTPHVPLRAEGALPAQTASSDATPAVVDRTCHHRDAKRAAPSTRGDSELPAKTAHVVVTFEPPPVFSAPFTPASALYSANLPANVDIQALQTVEPADPDVPRLPSKATRVTPAHHAIANGSEVRGESPSFEPPSTADPADITSEPWLPGPELPAWTSRGMQGNQTHTWPQTPGRPQPEKAPSEPILARGDREGVPDTTGQVPAKPPQRQSLNASAIPAADLATVPGGDRGRVSSAPPVIVGVESASTPSERNAASDTASPVIEFVGSAMPRVAPGSTSNAPDEGRVEEFEVVDLKTVEPFAYVPDANSTNENTPVTIAATASADVPITQLMPENLPQERVRESAPLLVRSWTSPQAPSPLPPDALGDGQVQASQPGIIHIVPNDPALKLISPSAPQIAPSQPALSERPVELPADPSTPAYVSRNISPLPRPASPLVENPFDERLSTAGSAETAPAASKLPDNPSFWSREAYPTEGAADPPQAQDTAPRGRTVLASATADQGSVDMPSESGDVEEATCQTSSAADSPQDSQKPFGPCTDRPMAGRTVRPPARDVPPSVPAGPSVEIPKVIPAGRPKIPATAVGPETRWLRSSAQEHPDTQLPERRVEALPETASVEASGPVKAAIEETLPSVSQSAPPRPANPPAPPSSGTTRSVPRDFQTPVEITAPATASTGTPEVPAQSTSQAQKAARPAVRSSIFKMREHEHSANSESPVPSRWNGEEVQQWRPPVVILPADLPHAPEAAWQVAESEAKPSRYTRPSEARTLSPTTPRILPRVPQGTEAPAPLGDQSTNAARPNIQPATGDWAEQAEVAFTARLSPVTETLNDADVVAPMAELPGRAPVRETIGTPRPVMRTQDTTLLTREPLAGQPVRPVTPNAPKPPVEDENAPARKTGPQPKDSPAPIGRCYRERFPPPCRRVRSTTSTHASREVMGPRHVSPFLRNSRASRSPKVK